jgi:peptidoglycan/LPS O-acetylase OafA/YrhL
MLQAWVPQAAVTWNGPGWSLSAEAFFYLCFPWIGRLIFRLPSIAQSIIAVFGLWLLQISLPLVCVIMHIPGIGTAVATSNLETTIASVLKYNPLLQLPFFLTGIVCCRLFLLLKTRNSPLFGHGYLVYLPSFALLAAMLVNADRVPYVLSTGGLTLIPAAGAVLGLAFGDRFCSRVLSASWLVFLGKASYAEYLLHFPIRAAFDAKLGYVWSPLTEGAYLAAVLVVSATVYQFYEEPLQRRLRSWIHIPAAVKALQVGSERSTGDGSRIGVAAN